MDFGRSESWRGDKLELGVADKLASEPEEGFLEVVVGFGGDVIVLQVLLAVEGDGFGFDFALLHVDFVTAEDDGDALADTDEVAYGVLVGNLVHWGFWCVDVRCQLGTFL
jgi:hypothetical protein